MSQEFFTLEISDPRFEENGLRHITVKSPSLGGRGDISVFVPQGFESGSHLPVTVLLHGVYGSHWSWAHQAGVHLTTQKLITAGVIQPMVLAMPSDGLFGDGSGYLRHSRADYEQWIVEEVPRALRTALPVVSEKSELYITGLSMGGYGALRLGAKNPHIFKGFSGLSSITEFSQVATFSEPNTFRTLADEVENPESVLEILTANRTTLQPFRFDCGDSDPLFEANRALHLSLSHHRIHHTFEILPGGHTWEYWERNIAASLVFFNTLHTKGL